MEITVSIINGKEGLAVCINDFRICGAKPWGGAKVLKTWKVDIKLLLQALVSN